ncbi:MAG: hypothetical protein AAGB46_15000, partial [Verrucomicrobiota bacterium]
MKRIVFLASWATTAFCLQAAEPDEQEIVQEKNKVDLVGDANLDESINRRPDLDYSNVSIDHENSGSNLTTIPSAAVLKAEVLKAATPDLDADTRGGILKVVYRPSYRLEERVTKARVYSRYKSMYDSLTPLGDFTYADRIGENAGFRITTEYQNLDRGSDSMNFDWSEGDVDAISTPYLNRIDLRNSRRSYDIFRVNSSFDYRFSDDVDVYLRFNYERERADTISSSVQYRYGNEEDFDFLDENEGLNEAGRIRRQASRWDVEEDKTSLTLGGKAKMGPIDIDWRFQRNEETDTDLNREEVSFDR